MADKTLKKYESGDSDRNGYNLDSIRTYLTYLLFTAVAGLYAAGCAGGRTADVDENELRQGAFDVADSLVENYPAFSDLDIDSSSVEYQGETARGDKVFIPHFYYTDADTVAEAVFIGQIRFDPVTKKYQVDLIQ